MSRVRHGPKAFLRELKRRKVITVVVAYVVAAAGVLQVADLVAPRMNLPDDTVKWIILLAVIGLPIVTVLAWLYDVVPDSPAEADDVAHKAPAKPLAPESSTPAVEKPRAKPRSIAVLPFQNLSADAENEFFADGVTEDVIAQLAKIGALSVISRTSAMQFKQRNQSLREIGEALGVKTLLEGSVRRAANRVRITAQLVDAHSNEYLWVETYDRQMTDVFAIQTDVALQIADALQARLSPDEKRRIKQEPTADMHAYQLYLQGRQQLGRGDDEGTATSIGYFKKAIELDPKYALAYAGLAKAYGEMGVMGAADPAVVYPAAQEAAATALRLDPNLAEAHSSLAQLRVAYEFDWAGAEQLFKRALELSPSSADAWDLYGRFCSAMERWDEAIAMEQRAQELDPLVHRTDLANALIRAGKYDAALENAKHSVELDPHYDRGRATLGWAYIKKGMFEEGISQLRKAVAISPGTTTWYAQLGQALAMAGQTDEANQIREQLEDRARHSYVSPYHLAYVYTGLGEFDKAMDYLEQAFEARDGAIYGAKGSFLFTALRSHPRFVAMARRMNL